jgi:RNase P/RNase MRP subunit POP5
MNNKIKTRNTTMKKINLNEIALNTRRTWGSVKPATKAFKSKRDYNRKDKSWMKED